MRMVGAVEAEAIRDAVEEAMATMLATVFRSYLADVKRAALSGIVTSPATALTAADAAPLPKGEVPSLGEHAARWQAGIDAAGAQQRIMDAFNKVYDGYYARRELLSASVLSNMESYAMLVRDRLVRGTYFGVTVYDGSFEAVRVALAESVIEGWSRPQLAARIAAELSWDGNSAYWQALKDRTDSSIDAVLDSIGPIGSPQREYARMHDPLIQRMRDTRNRAIKHLDAEKSVWQTRATLIARTEATGIANYGAQEALRAEGVTEKEWMATGGIRTRPTHSRADHQIVPIDDLFKVGRGFLRFPGDPNGPVEEVANCRCTMVAATQPSPANRYKVSNVDPDAVHGIDWLDEPDDPMNALRNANTPYYHAIRARNDDLAVVGNCQKATTSYELRRRGLDTSATLGEGGPMWGWGDKKGFYDWWGVRGHEVLLMGDDLPRVNYKQIANYMTTTFPPNSRGAVVCQWKSGGGHIFNWERDTAGRLLFVDAQNGQVYGPTNPVWQRIKKNSMLQVVRLDDKKFLADGARAVISPTEIHATVGPVIAKMEETRQRIERLTREIGDIVDEFVRAKNMDPLREIELLGRKNTLQAERAALYDELDRLRIDTTAIQGVTR